MHESTDFHKQPTHVKWVMFVKLQKKGFSSNLLLRFLSFAALGGLVKKYYRFYR